MTELVDFNLIRKILETLRTVAVVGCSPKPGRPSHDVARYLVAAGFTVIPVNPGQHEILGLPCYPDLAAVPCPVDVVNIFRRPEEVPAVVEAAIAKKARVVWMQEGIVHREAARRAQEAGLWVVMDRCIKTDYQNLVAGRSG